MTRHLIMSLESPLMSFGGETVDNNGVIRPFPAVSMLTGLFANALGWRRIERERHQNLQDRIVFAARIDREPADGARMTDFQSAAINNSEKAWTTRGRLEERKGGSYRNHLRYRDYFADMQVTVALRLNPESDIPTLDDLAAALQEPERPLFIGRKPCLPSAPLFAGFQEAATTLEAIQEWHPAGENANQPNTRAIWPGNEGINGIRPARSYMLTDQRNWISGLHGGGRPVHEGRIPRKNFSADKDRTDQTEEGQQE